ncbi:ABC transporter substrate-binding protein [Shewanella submarina]|uniref:Substrate-binding periplasmic protein n=1 Tax=Shewanella submarina TaxID=2016376 RepID=A0ABV7GJ51_9GAMM|nr:ABC transporter substrate-binding protein [Shewanella submarina]MCL1036132.1 ABC transporter substrate-binding protein [Shewanella submarina]
MHKLFLQVLATLLMSLAFSFFATGRSYDDIVDSGVLKVALYRDFPPFSYMQNGQAKGLDVELAKALAEGMQTRLEILWATPGENTGDDLRQYLWKGSNLHTTDGTRVKADVMLRIPYDKAYAQQRDDTGRLAHELVHMFGPYHQERWQLAFNPKKIEDVPTMAVFQYHPIGVEIDSAPQFFLTTAFGGRLRNNTRSFADLPGAWDAMSKGEVDAVMGMLSQIQWLDSRDPGKGRLATRTYPLFGKQTWELGMAVKDDYRQLAYALEDIMLTALKDGRMAQWASDNGFEYQMPPRYEESR